MAFSTRALAEFVHAAATKSKPVDALNKVWVRSTYTADRRKLALATVRDLVVAKEAAE
jgi:hypothetical protein